MNPPLSRSISTERGARSFGAAPGLTEHAIHVRSDHRAGVIERKERIEPDLLKLPLSGNRTALTFVGFMDCEWKMSSDRFWVVRILI